MDMKNNLYASQDNEYRAEVALRRLWSLFINGMSYTSYLRTTHYGKEVRMEWDLPEKTPKEAFSECFTFVEQDSDYSPILEAECAMFVRSMETLDKPHSGFVAEQ
jgi:hypothetical protein